MVSSIPNKQVITGPATSRVGRDLAGVFGRCRGGAPSGRSKAILLALAALERGSGRQAIGDRGIHSLTRG